MNSHVQAQITRLSLFLSLLCTALSAIAEENSLLLRDVTLHEHREDGTPIVVSIVIRDGLLELVTEDTVSADTVTTAFDAAGTTLVGQLVPGEAPSFIVLNGDPSEDFYLLLDTGRHTRFAMRKGEVVRNQLTRLLPGREPVQTGWLGYTPPPLALPGSYRDAAKWNRFDTRAISGIGVVSLVLDRMQWQSQDNASVEQVGDLDAFDGGAIRAFRFGAVGTLNFDKPWVYTFFLASNAFEESFDSRENDNLKIFDLRLDIPIVAGTTLSIGKQREPISMERTTSLLHWPIQERAIGEDAFLPARNIGLVWSGTAFSEDVTWALGGFNDWLETDESFSENATQFSGRTTWVPFESRDGIHLLHFGLAGRYTDAANGIRLTTTPEFRQAPNFVDTGLFEAASAWTYEGEVTWRGGPFWLHGEFLYTDIDAPELDNPQLRARHFTASWALTGEMREYNRRNGTFRPLPLARSVYQGGKGAWEAVTRFSSVDLTDGQIDGGEMNVATVGINWHLTPFVTFNFNYRWIELDRFGETGRSNGFQTRIVLVME